MRRKRPRLRNIGIDRDARALDGFECATPCELIHAAPTGFLTLQYAFPTGSELIYATRRI